MVTFFDLVEPDLEACIPRHRYTIGGIINGTIMQIAYQTGKLMLRIPLLTAKSAQLIVEIWNDNKKMEPKFADWKRNQFTLMRNLSYHGVGDFKCEKKVHIFRMSSGQSTVNRFIWITPETDSFWDKPVETPDISLENEEQKVSF